MKKLFSFAVLMISLMVFASCDETDLGRYCVVGFDNASGTAGVKAINAEAPECLDRICVFQSRISPTDVEEIETMQYCSKKCSGDGDCSDSEKGSCSLGFICIRIGGESEDLNGKCICECRDFLTTKDFCDNRCKLSEATKDDECDLDN
ncbi:hypothetical protein KKF34_02675 [Myxococcota bacterium]|nr:hypothetical protein [Myxococcota bacterium]MBU1380958.1 hypothetical protein [Myxococcota bacterium]MBU1495766.1 hypothetical protein [Myxococcota bacterium]